MMLLAEFEGENLDVFLSKGTRLTGQCVEEDDEYIVLRGHLGVIVQVMKQHIASVCINQSEGPMYERD
jgi:sRNA-binding regulator protein Hfq